MDEDDGHATGFDTAGGAIPVGGVNFANGVDTERCDTEGSDTEDTEHPLTRQEQVVALLDIKALHPPPLPIHSMHARATAKAVLMHTLQIHPAHRKQAHNFALAMPLTATSIAEWVEQHLCLQRKEHTLKTALFMALNPNRPAAWVLQQSGCSSGHMYVVRGLALHLRMHPFTRSEVQYACDHLLHYMARVKKLSVSPTAFGCNMNKRRMQAANTLLSLQSGARVFKM